MIRLASFAIGCLILFSQLGCERTSSSQHFGETPEEMEARLNASAKKYIAAGWEGRSLPIGDGVISLDENITLVRLTTSFPQTNNRLADAVFMEVDGELQVSKNGRKIQSLTLRMPAAALTAAIDEWSQLYRSSELADGEVQKVVTFQSREIKTMKQRQRAQIRGDWSMRGKTVPTLMDLDYECYEGRVALIGDFMISREALGLPPAAGRWKKRIRGRLSIPQLAVQPSYSDGSDEETDGSHTLSRRTFDPLAVFQQRDQDGDGQLAGEEIGARMRDNFAAFDTDGDEVVSLDEFQTRMAELKAERQAGGGGEPRRSGTGEGPPARL